MAPARRRRQVQQGTNWLRSIWDEWERGNEWGHIGHDSDSSEAETEKAEEVLELGGDGDGGGSGGGSGSSSASQRAPSPITGPGGSPLRPAASQFRSERSKTPRSKTPAVHTKAISDKEIVQAVSPPKPPATAAKTPRKSGNKRKVVGQVPLGFGFSVPLYEKTPSPAQPPVRIEEPDHGTPPPTAPAPSKALKPGFTSFVDKGGHTRYKKGNKFASAAAALA